MNLQLKSLLAGAALATCAVSVISSLHAQTGTVASAAPVPVQYKIIASGNIPDGKVIEEEINRMAAQGWRVRASIMAGVIMERN
jgi:hypothetical protein